MALQKMDKNKFFSNNIIKSLTNSRLEEFHRYSLDIEEKFDSDKNALSSSYNKAINGLSEDEIREVEDYFSDDYYIIEEIHIGLYRNSTLVSVYSFLENSMNCLCRHLNSRHTYPVSLSDLRGEGIVRAKDYLEKLAKVDFTALNGEWSHLTTLNKIRNCIVHSEGDIKASKNPEQLENIINSTPGLSLTNERKIKIEREYIPSCINKVQSFLEKLHQQAFAI